MMQKFALLALLVLPAAPASGANAAPVVWDTPTITSDTTWSGDLLLRQNVVVSPDATLRITAGTNVLVESGKGIAISVMGRIVVAGKPGTDIAIHAGGSTALPLWEGQFTMGDIFRINGYGFNTVNTLGFQLATFNMTGEALWMGLEFGLSQIEINDEYFIQVSGLEYKYDATKPVGERVVSVLINGEVINPSAVYSVTANEIVLAILDYTQIPYSDPNILVGVTEFEAVVAQVMALDNFLHPKGIGRVVNVGDRLSVNKIKSDGWFNSELGCFIEDPTITGHLNFNMNLHNINHPNSAQGVVKIKFPAARINLTGNDLEFLLIENNIITVRGEGKNTGKGKYGFISYSG